MPIIARYKEQVNSTSNYGRARQFYAKANHLEMRNARPFNMLAILAKISNRKFEAVYYHARYLLFLIIKTLTPSQVPLYQERVHVEQGGLGDHL